MKATQKDAIDNLRNLLVEGETVYTVLRHCSASGMTRYLDIYIMRDNEPQRITYTVSKALDWTYSDKYGALKVGGCGMDMGYHAVYTLSRVVFKGLVEGGRDAGYRLEHRWM